MVKRETFWLIAPYAAWMLLMMALPATVAGYAIRTAVVAALLAVGWARRSDENDKSDASDKGKICRLGLFGRLRLFSLAFFVGLFVFAVWVLPEQFDWAWYRRWFIVGEGGTCAVAESGAAMVAVRLVGSAFVISVAEELFFRR